MKKSERSCMTVNEWSAIAAETVICVAGLARSVGRFNRAVERDTGDNGAELRHARD